ncbi:hypothetical protein [Desmospora profundinema]|uniref:Uncharacterized protein n=1 Tax=Desmospora profundinema TaxID=1571184 RepID=A0ABU1IMM2_9BACL|nr:hypothetical protein [Desmospora profundinema]MDR6225209.1 hypothetical protein [Desmospora profundinema]
MKNIAIFLGLLALIILIDTGMDMINTTLDHAWNNLLSQWIIMQRGELLFLFVLFALYAGQRWRAASRKKRS